MNKFKKLALLILSLLVSTPLAADQWISLGGDVVNMVYELDKDSITRRDNVVYATMRVRSPDGTRVAIMISNLSIHCNRGFAQIESGQMGFVGTRLVPFRREDLSSELQIHVFPSPNQAYNNMYNFVCS